MLRRTIFREILIVYLLNDTVNKLVADYSWVQNRLNTDVKADYRQMYNFWGYLNLIP